MLDTISNCFVGTIYAFFEFLFNNDIGTYLIMPVELRDKELTKICNEQFFSSKVRHIVGAWEWAARKITYQTNNLSML